MNQIDPGKALGNQTVMTLFDNQAMAIDNSVIGTYNNFPGLAQGTATTAFKTTNPFAYTSSGQLKTKGAGADVTLTTGGAHNITASASAAQERVYMVTVNGAGTLAITAGTVASGAGNAALPERPTTDGITPIGYVRITVAAGGSNFVAGTTATTTAGSLTVVYTDGYPMPRFGRSF